MTIHKKLSLLAFLCLETIALGVLGFVAYQKWIDRRTEDAVEKMTVLGEDTVMQTDDGRLRHYYTLRPNSTESIQPKKLPYVATYTYNADGLHERYDYAVPKPEHVFRIVALGDSFTFGQLVNTEDNWTERLEDLLNDEAMSCNTDRFEVINLGMPGFDVQYIIHRYLTIGKKYEPDLIVWLESGSGLTRINELVLPLVKECRNDVSVIQEDPDNESNVIYYRCWDKAEEEVRTSLSDEALLALVGSYLEDFYQQISATPVTLYAFKPNSVDDARIETLREWTRAYGAVRLAPIITDVVGAGNRLFDGHPDSQGHRIMAREIYEDLLATTLTDICREGGEGTPSFGLRD